MGQAFSQGKYGLATNCGEAVKWWRQAAEQNLAAAQSTLGVCFERGEGLAKYELEACKWHLLAAAQGDNKAKRTESLLELLLSPQELAEGQRRTQNWLGRARKTK